MSDIVPIFVSHYSIGDPSLLTLEEPGKAKDNSPLSVFDLAKEANLSSVLLVENRIDGFVQAMKNAKKAGVKLCYGIKLCICSDASLKEPDSIKTESKVIILVQNTQGYSDLIRIWNRAAVDGFYHHPRTDWKTLKEFWTPNLLLALPFFSSFVATNTLTFNRIVPDLPVRPIVFREVGSDLPFAPLIDKALDGYVAEAQIPPEDVVLTKTVLYRNRADFVPYMVLRCIGEKTFLETPNIDHLNSDSFCLESWRELSA